MSQKVDHLQRLKSLMEKKQNIAKNVPSRPGINETNMPRVQQVRILPPNSNKSVRPVSSTPRFNPRSASTNPITTRTSISMPVKKHEDIALKFHPRVVERMAMMRKRMKKA